MKAVKMLGNCQVEIRDVLQPKATPGHVVVKMRTSAICGSDLHALYEVPDATDFTPGHEFMGEVVEIASDSRLRPGDRVAVFAMVGCQACEYCRRGEISLCEKGTCYGFGLDGGDAEYVLVREDCCLLVPDDIPNDVAVLSGDVIGVSWMQLRRARAEAHELIVVSGLGPLGLGAVIVGKYLGCRVLGVDVNQYRVDLAKRRGADWAYNVRTVDLKNTVEEISGGKGINVGVECAAKDESLRFLLDNAAKWGRICLVGEHAQATISPSDHFIRRNLTMIGSTYFEMGAYAGIIRVLQSMPNAGDVITHRFPLSEAAQAFAIFKEGNTGKVIFVNE